MLASGPDQLPNAPILGPSRLDYWSLSARHRLFQQAVTFPDVGCIEPQARQRYHGGAPSCEGMNPMEAARTTEVVIGATSSHSFEDAIAAGVSRATATLRGVEGVRIKDMNVLIEDGNITGYKVNLEVT